MAHKIYAWLVSIHEYAGEGRNPEGRGTDAARFPEYLQTASLHLACCA